MSCIRWNVLFNAKIWKKNPRPRRYFTSLSCYDVLFYSTHEIFFCSVLFIVVWLRLSFFWLFCYVFFSECMLWTNHHSLHFASFLPTTVWRCVFNVYSEQRQRDERERERHSQKQTEVLTSLLLRQSLIDLFTTDWLYILLFVPCFCQS